MRRDRAVRFVVHDGGGQYTRSFDDVFTAIGAESITTPPGAPRANSYAERWVRSVRHELLDRTIVWNERQLRVLLGDYVAHYNEHRRTARSDNGRRRAQMLLRLVRPNRSSDAPPVADSSTSTTQRPERLHHGQATQTPGPDAPYHQSGPQPRKRTRTTRPSRCNSGTLSLDLGVSVPLWPHSDLGSRRRQVVEIELRCQKFFATSELGE